MNIGLFGGTFNPVHNGHLLIANTFFKQLNLNELLFIPNYISPFKIGDNNLIQDFHRIEMLKLAVSENISFKIELFEINKQEVSFTINTLDFLKKKYSNSDNFFLLIGADQTQYFHKWKDWMKILDKVTLCISGRDNVVEMFNDEVKNHIINNNISIKIIKSPFIDISSSEIRNKIKNKIGVNNLLDQRVIEYIRQNNLYL